MLRIYQIPFNTVCHIIKTTQSIAHKTTTLSPRDELSNNKSLQAGILSQDFRSTFYNNNKDDNKVS